MFDVRCFGQHMKSRAQLFPNLVLNRIGSPRSIDQHDAFWLSRNQVAISFPNTLIKFSGLLFHAIGFAPRALHSRLRRESVDIQHESNVRNAFADGKCVEVLDYLAIQLPCRALINSRRIEKPVGDHAHAAVERGLDYLTHQLTAAGFEKKKLSLRRHVGIMRRKLQKLANAFPDRGATWFAGQHTRNTGALKTCSESLSLCGFSASLRSLERDER
jgi:hypothetical protein